MAAARDARERVDERRRQLRHDRREHHAGDTLAGHAVEREQLRQHEDIVVRGLPRLGLYGSMEANFLSLEADRADMTVFREHGNEHMQTSSKTFSRACRETTVSPTFCVLTARCAAEHGRPKVPIRKLSPSGSIKTVIHAPGFYDFALQNLFHARSRAKHCILEKLTLSTN